MSRFAVGNAAVYVFFCLSGFWVYSMYTGRYSKTRMPYLTYLVSRLWRLLPTFWLVTLLTFLLIYPDGTLAGYWQRDGAAHFLLSNFLIFGYYFLPDQAIVPAWSLDIEMQFYLIAPLIAILLVRRKLSALLVLLAAAVISVASVWSGNRIPMAGFLVFFVFGMVAASVRWHPSGRLVAICLGLVGLATAGCIASPWRGILLVGSHSGPLAVFTPHANVVLALLVLPYAIYTTRQKGFSMDGMFGDLSYVVYLLHWYACNFWIQAHLGHRFSAAVVGWIAVSMLAWVIWRFYDHPINRMRSRWVSARMLPAPAEPGLAESGTVQPGPALPAAATTEIS